MIPVPFHPPATPPHPRLKEAEANNPDAPSPAAANNPVGPGASGQENASAAVSGGSTPATSDSLPPEPAPEAGGVIAASVEYSAPEVVSGSASKAEPEAAPQAAEELEDEDKQENGEEEEEFTDEEEEDFEEETPAAPAWNPDALTESIDDLRGEMTASTAEWRRGSKRQMEALKEFGGVLQSMGEMMRDLHQKLRQETAPSAAPAVGSELPGEWLHILIDLHDRVSRSAAAQAIAPAGTHSAWPAARADLHTWGQAWKTQAEATGMLLAHLQSLLRRAGLQPVPALGQAFDPATMQAVEVVTDPKIPDHRVIAELLPGWITAATGRLLRPAQVRVSRQQASSAA